MYLGRIVSNQRKFDPIEFIEHTSDLEKNTEDIPTLIVGKAFAESIYGKDKVKILDRKITKNVYWTYSKTEKRSAYDEDVEKFKSMVYSNALKTMKYQFFSMFRSNLSKKKGLIEFINNRKIKKVIYIKGEHIYIYYGDKLIIGLSLAEMEYLGISRDKVIKRLTNNPNNKILFNDSFISYAVMRLVGNNFFIIPYLYAVKNENF